MNRLQILTGACNPGENCYAVGSVEGVHFTAYAAGCNIAILAGNFERVQIIPGVAHGNIKVTCIDCSTDTGKIAASYGKKVYIFEPTPIAADSSSKLDYKWYKTAEIETDCYVNSLSWNLDGSKLLTGGELIQIWQFVPKQKQHHGEGEGEGEDGLGRKVHFQLGEPGTTHDPDEEELSKRLSHALDGQLHDLAHEAGTWDCVWKCKPATPVYHLQFSYDGFLFASAGKADRLVKIWYEDLKVQQGFVRMDSLSPRKDVLHYSFVYIAHPRAVTGFTWRKTSKYMPRGAVANMLVTSCVDNVCRIWVETILPDDGLVDVDQFDPSIPHDPKQNHNHNRSKNRFIQRLKTIRHAIHKRRKPKYGPETVMSSSNLSSMSSVHDFHRFAIHHNGVSPVLHFHLAGSINPETGVSGVRDLPLLPLAGSSDATHNFRLHWLDNKELQFTMEAEKLLQELHTKLQADESLMNPSPPPSMGTVSGGLDEEKGRESSDGGNYSEAETSLKEEQSKKKKTKKSSRKKKEKEKLGSRANSSSSLASEEGPSVNDLAPSVLERLDRNIDFLLKDWQSSSDMLFSIHPVDGSFLMWHVDWLDEFPSQAVRQAQVSFASRLPRAFPIPDASTMACNLLLYCNYSRMDIKSAMKITENELLSFGSHSHKGRNGSSLPVVPDNMLIPNVLLVTKHHNGTLNQWQVSFTDSSKFQQVVSVAHTARACGHRFRANLAACHPVLPLLLTTSHHNIPDPEMTPERESLADDENAENKSRTAAASSFAFCSELILWQVGHVGPLSKTGGIVELARINSPDINAFTSMAWVPTLLPSTSLGSYTYSPSALFVASDGSSLRLYQAVIDARLLLSEPKPVKKFDSTGTSSSSANSSSEASPPPVAAASAEMFNMVSLQSSARPGCILELEPINDATADWQNIQLLHVFQEPLVADHRSKNLSQTSLGANGFGDSLSAYVDLSSMANFEENFYLVVLERLTSKMGDEGSRLHMWKITISSQPTQAPIPTDSEVNGVDGETDSGHVDFYDSDDEAAIMFHASQNLQTSPAPSMRMSITTVKVCNQTLSLPMGVSVISANVAAGHLSSASIYPACFAPYLLTTACSDGQVRFWKCHMSDMEPNMRHDNSFNITNYHFTLEPGAGLGLVQPAVTMSQQWRPQEHDYSWSEWQMMSANRSSAISVPGKPITVSCAYSGRMAVAYRRGNVRAQPDHPEEKFINLYVAIYECESTGGSDWVLEDTIELENIKIPDPKAEIELSQVLSSQPALPPGLSIHSDPFCDLTPYPALPRTKSVPSLSTIQSVRKSIAEQGNRLGLLKQKCLVMLDWVSAEDGSHILTVGVGTRILAYCQVSNEIAQASVKANKSTGRGDIRETSKKSDMFPHRPKGLLQKSKSLAVDDFEEEIRWMRLRAIELETADGLPPLPMHASWVRGGILVVGMDNELHVYTQWRGNSGLTTSSAITSGSSTEESSSMGDPLTHDKRTLTEANLASMVSSAALNKAYKSMSNFKSSLSLSTKKDSMWKLAQEQSRKPDSKNTSSNLVRTDSMTSLTMMHDFGLFEAARLANPVLPQYHPEQLKALLSFGKIRRVKAILAHLLRCIIGTDSMQAVFSDLSNEDGVRITKPRSRSGSAASDDDPDGLSVAAPANDSFDFMELTSIPPLPIYALMTSDADNTGAHFEIAGTVAAEVSTGQQQDYTNLFSSSFKEETLDLSEDAPRRHQSSSSILQQMNLYAFTPVHSKILSKQLMRISLPGLNSLDQMYLVAMADTVAHCKMDFADHFAEAKEGSLANDSQTDLNQATESMDDCGLRFVLAMRQHIYLLSTLPLLNRVPLQRQGLRSYSMVWAFHSEAHEELLSMIPCMQKDEPTWDELRQFGVGWWLTNPTRLRTVMERVAKVAFQRNKEPMDSALFYLAMKKKNVLWGLFRSVDNRVKADFFKKDFTLDESKRIAKKNAFHLMGKQKIMDSAALFLLAGSLPDAIMVILDKLHDFQLALVVCRLYEIDDPFPDSVCQLLYKHILGMDSKGENHNPSEAHPDPFLRSMAFWTVRDYQAALNTLLEDKVGHNDDKNDPDAVSTKPNIFSFYNYLRTHPLLLRLRLAAATLTQRRAILTGFTRANSVAVSDKITTIDRVTWRERKLFFATATTHLKNGCPLLALEVMTRLPPSIASEDSVQPSIATQNQESISTGILGTSITKKASDLGWSTPLAGSGNGAQKTEAFDWGTPVSEHNKLDSFDWSAPVANQSKAEDYDWGASLSKGDFDNDLDLDLKLDSDSEVTDEEAEDTEGDKSKGKGKVRFQLMEGDNGEDDVSGEEEEKPGKEDDLEKPTSLLKDNKVDIMAQQFKYIACLKILMEELSTLATGFEVDGGQLRYQLYVWLEKEVEVLKVLCNYGLSEEVTGAEEVDSGHPDSDEETGIAGTVGRQRTFSQRSDSSRASLHETILADKYDLDFKERRLAKRKRWLRQHQHLLRTLASYCILQGSSGGGLASVYMELLLLLQELQQERVKQQLKSPLPFPTTLPLLSASLSSSRSVIADPIQYLQRMTSDLLITVTGFPTPPSASSNMAQVISMRNLAMSLSSCIYQCLCDSDSFSVNLAKATETAQDTFMGSMFVAPNSSLMAGILRQRKRSSDSNNEERINTTPAKWPGVTSLQCLLLSAKDEDAPKLHVMLCEALVSVYLSLLMNGLAMFDPSFLYRLLSNKMSQATWGLLFGGGCRTVLRIEKNIPSEQLSKLTSDPTAKQRLKFNMKVMMGREGGKKDKDMPVKETYKERFIAPEISMISYFTSKPAPQPATAIINYDSDNELDVDVTDGQENEEDEDWDEEATSRPKTLNLSGQQEHCDPTSYSWYLMRYAILRAVISHLRTFLPQIGIELSELPIVSPMLHAVMKLLDRWEALSHARLDLFAGPPDNYIPGLTLDIISGKPSSKLEALYSAENTPFINCAATLPVKRLWFFLLRQDSLPEVFLRYIYRRPPKHVNSDDESMRTGSSDEPKLQDPMKIVHKEQDIITSFCINQANTSIISLATQNKLLELDIGLILHPPSWLGDDNEYDIEMLRNPINNATETMPEFLVVHTPQETPQPHSGSQTPNTPYPSSPAGSVQGGLQTGRGSSVQPKLPSKMNIQRALAGVRKMAAHPTLQYYLTGSQDGAVRLWEWDHRQPVTVLRAPGNFPKVTRALFNQQGNKCCVSDGEGSICLWQVGLGSNFNKPIMSLPCHNKTTSDFTFVGCSSLIATAGHSTENKNVCLWDTLMPPRQALVHAFVCHEHGSPAIIYALQSQTLISGGRKGEINHFDLRQRKVRNTFQAHDSAIKCLAIDPQEEFYVTGSAEGDIRVWTLNSNQLSFAFQGEHSKNTFFRSVGSTSGVTQVSINGSGHLFSCGADGSMKFRQLPEKEMMIHHFM